jgi:hypothetical protein
MRKEQAFSNGETFIIDLFEFYHGVRDRLSDELGAVVFDEQMKNLVADIAMFTFHGDKSIGERAIEKTLIKLYLKELTAIKLSRRFFDLFYRALRIETVGELLGRYDYFIDFSQHSMYITLVKEKEFNHHPLEINAEELDDVWIPERQRRNYSGATN